MQANTLYRLSGVSAIIAAILLLILGVGFLVVGDPNVPQFIFYSLSGGVAHIFFMFVLMGTVYALAAIVVFAHPRVRRVDLELPDVRPDDERTAAMVAESRSEPANV